LRGKIKVADRKRTFLNYSFTRRKYILSHLRSLQHAPTLTSSRTSLKREQAKKEQAPVGFDTTTYNKS
jgi:hypothetical protein